MIDILIDYDRATYSIQQFIDSSTTILEVIDTW